MVTPFSARFRHRLLRAAGLSALVAPSVLVACADKVTVFGPDDDGSSTSSGGASGPTSSSSGVGGQGGAPTTVVTAVSVSGVTTGVTTGGGAPPTTTLCWEIDGPCPTLQSAPNALGPCGPEYINWVEAWIDGPFKGPEGECCYEVEANPGCGVGRPYLEDQAPVVAPLVASLDWPGAPGESSDLAEALRGALAEAWAHDAQHEHASVASFARVALELMALGAPPALITAAHRAAGDEVEHARLCFALASRFAGAPVGPGPLPLGDAVPLTRDLASMAAATVAEGCIGETLAVAVAQAQLEKATDPEVRAALTAIVDDESRHAELAWSTVAWAIRTGGAAVRHAVESAFASATQRRVDVLTTDAPELAAYGRLGAAEAEAVQRRTLAEVILPCAASLLRTQPRRSSPRQSQLPPTVR